MHDFHPVPHSLVLQGVPRTQLQLVAVACMLIAAKHEEVRSGACLLRVLICPRALCPWLRLGTDTHGVHLCRSCILRCWTSQKSLTTASW
jgi:hypothetical protein